MCLNTYVCTYACVNPVSTPLHATLGDGGGEDNNDEMVASAGGKRQHQFFRMCLFFKKIFSRKHKFQQLKVKAESLVYIL